MLASVATTYVIDAKVFIEGPDGTIHVFDDIADCKEWGDVPDGWSCEEG